MIIQFVKPCDGQLIPKINVSFCWKIEVSTVAISAYYFSAILKRICNAVDFFCAQRSSGSVNQYIQEI